MFERWLERMKEFFGRGRGRKSRSRPGQSLPGIQSAYQMGGKKEYRERTARKMAEFNTLPAVVRNSDSGQQVAAARRIVLIDPMVARRPGGLMRDINSSRSNGRFDS